MRTLHGLFLITLLNAATAPGLLAGLVSELEINGTTSNNTIATAQTIAGSAFTLPVPATVFSPPVFPTATIQGQNGGNDVDFFAFQSPFGGRIFLDIDNSPATFDPLVALFNSAGTLLGYSDDSPIDPGSVNQIDSFLGMFTLPSPGTYFIGISQNPNFPTTALTGIETPLVRPDGGFGGVSVSGVPSGVSTYDFNGPQLGGAAYTLNVSLEADAVPEPGYLVMVGVVIGLMGIHRIRRKAFGHKA